MPKEKSKAEALIAEIKKEALEEATAELNKVMKERARLLYNDLASVIGKHKNLHIGTAIYVLELLKVEAVQQKLYALRIERERAAKKAQDKAKKKAKGVPSREKTKSKA